MTQRSHQNLTRHLRRARSGLTHLVAALGIAAIAARSADTTGQDASKTMPVPPAPVAPSAVTMARGDVMAIDRQAQTITVKHGPLISVRMPEATTVLRVKDSSMLDRLKVGDRINFSVDRANGALTMTQVELAK
jgi:Cu(I)/Ag(I) efflux system periplasmic protein CusF